MLTIRREPAQTSMEMRDAYNRLYQLPHVWLSRRYSLSRWLLRLIRPRPGCAMLDIACGEGALLAVARSAGLVCYGVDISDQAVGLAALRVGDRVAVAGDGERLPFPGDSFDYVTSIGSLEHYADMGRGITEMVRVLRPGGSACILVPNAFGLTWSVWNAWRTGRLADDEHQPIQRFATRCVWHELLEDHGLKVQRTLGHEQPWPRSSREWRFYLANPKEFLLLLLSPLVPLNLARHFVFVCCKASSI